MKSQSAVPSDHAREEVPANRGRRRLRYVVLAAVVAVLVSSVLYPVWIGARTAGPDVNLVGNGTFERDAFGWEGDSRTVLTRSSGRQSPFALRIVGSRKRTSELSAFAWPIPVTHAVPGRSYRSEVWVRSPGSPLVVTMELAELSRRLERKLFTSRSSVTLSSGSWTQIVVSHRAVEVGASIGLTLSTGKVGRGSWVDVDDVSLSGPRRADPVTEQNTAPYPIYAAAGAWGRKQDAEWTEIPATRRAATPSRRSGQAKHTEPLPSWRLAWSEEFDGDQLDRTRWKPLNDSTYGEGNGEVACLMDRQDNLRLGGGRLSIVAKKESPPIGCGTDGGGAVRRSYTSAHLETKGTASFQYGRFEIRARTPNQHGVSKGLWPAFWLRPVNGGIGELDVLEIVGIGRDDEDTSNVVTQTLHYDYDGTHPQQRQVYRLPTGNFADGMHTFAAEWQPGEISWYVDGVLTSTRNTSTTPWIDDAFSGQFYLRLNMAVGGDAIGTPDRATRLPAVYGIDYVRVYQR